MDFSTATAGASAVHAHVMLPDNVKIGANGNLIVAELGGTSIIVIAPITIL
jgi:hypothetical protein